MSNKYLTIVAVGDRNSRKTDLLLKYTGGRQYNSKYKNYIIPRFQNTIHTIIVDYHPKIIHFVDAEPDDDYSILRRKSYQEADCILLCYSVQIKSTFENISKRWCIEVRKVAPWVPIILVATDIDARRDNIDTVSTGDGEKLKLLIGAAALIECSIEHFLGVDDVFIEAVRSTYFKNVR